MTLFYLDPPYYNVSSGGFYQFSIDDHNDLARTLREIDGKFMLTYDDDPNVRTLYDGFNIRKISSSLSSQKVNHGETRIQLRQLLITNFKLDN